MSWKSVAGAPSLSGKTAERRRGRRTFPLNLISRVLRVIETNSKFSGGANKDKRGNGLHFISNRSTSGGVQRAQKVGNGKEEGVLNFLLSKSFDVRREAYRARVYSTGNPRARTFCRGPSRVRLRAKEKKKSRPFEKNPLGSFEKRTFAVCFRKRRSDFRMELLRRLVRSVE